MMAKHQHHLRDSKVRELSKKLGEKFRGNIREVLGENPEIAELEEGIRVILADGNPVFFKSEEKYIPTLSTANSLSLKRITVDMGAVSHISDGADVMGPGVVEFNDDIKKGEIIGVDDEKNHKIIAIGKSLESGNDLKKDEGKVVKNIHYVGDKFWDLHKKI
ncbi:MAG: DUF1947 domain-containing protein [Hadesarchaea archaeon]|nr:DUF1947 domain-containing protein [Hadesarchaea archaeon]